VKQNDQAIPLRRRRPSPKSDSIAKPRTQSAEPMVCAREYSKPFWRRPFHKAIRHQDAWKLACAERVLNEQYDVDLMFTNGILHQSIELPAVSVPQQKRRHRKTFSHNAGVSTFYTMPVVVKVHAEYTLTS
jgi:hypothetical protein